MDLAILHIIVPFLAEAAEVSARIKPTQTLSDHDRAIFYSSWMYSAIRNASALPQCETREQIAETLGLSRRAVNSAVEFLLARGLCVERGGRLTSGPQSTHLPADSPLVQTHHTNWRVRAISAMDRLKSDSNSESRDLFFTSPLSLSQKDFLWARERALAMIQELAERVKKSPSEELACINIDWFKISR